MNEVYRQRVLKYLIFNLFNLNKIKIQWNTDIIWRSVAKVKRMLNKKEFYMMQAHPIKDNITELQ
jgi:hypothetical protein